MLGRYKVVGTGDLPPLFKGTAKQRNAITGAPPAPPAGRVLNATYSAATGNNIYVGRASNALNDAAVTLAGQTLPAAVTFTSTGMDDQQIINGATVNTFDGVNADSVVQSILGWNTHMDWSEKLQRAVLMGARSGHSAPGAVSNDTSAIDFDAETCHWTGTREPIAGNPLGHIYDSFCINEATDTMYFAGYINGSHDTHLRAFDINTRTQKSSFDIPNPSISIANIKCLEFHPHMGVAGSIVFITVNGIATYDMDSQTWTDRGTFTNDNIHPVALYIEKEKAVVFGSTEGTSPLYKIDSDGVVTELNTPPVGFHTANTEIGITINPKNNGKLYRFPLSGAENVSEFDVATTTWTSTIDTPPLYDSFMDLSAGPFLEGPYAFVAIPELNIMVIAARGATGQTGSMTMAMKLEAD